MCYSVKGVLDKFNRSFSNWILNRNWSHWILNRMTRLEEHLKRGVVWHEWRWAFQTIPGIVTQWLYHPVIEPYNDCMLWNKNGFWCSSGFLFKGSIFDKWLRSQTHSKPFDSRLIDSTLRVYRRPAAKRKEEQIASLYILRDSQIESKCLFSWNINLHVITSAVFNLKMFLHLTVRLAYHPASLLASRFKGIVFNRIKRISMSL